MTMIDKIKEIFSEILELKVEEVNSNAHIIKELGADSFDVVNLIMEIEEEFQVELPDQEGIEKLFNINTINTFLENQNLEWIPKEEPIGKDTEKSSDSKDKTKSKTKTKTKLW